jgi:signal peptidase
MKKNKKEILEFISSLLTKLLIIVLSIVALFLVFYIVTSTIAKKKGTNPPVAIYTIVSPSMEPYIKKYDVIINFGIKEEKDLKVGDIITFYSDSIDTNGFTVTHRINQILDVDGSKVYITKGDNNQQPDDGYITYKNIVGKYAFKIPQVGRVQFLLSSKVGWLIIILIPALGIILMDSIKIFKIVKIKNDEEELPKLKEVEKIREVKDNEKSKELIKKAKLLKKKVDRDEKE